MSKRYLPIFSALATLCLLAASAPAALAQESGTVQYTAPGQQPDPNKPDKYEGRDYSLARIVRLSLVDGDVQVRAPEDTEWQQAQLNLPIKQGFALATGRGARVEVEFESGATARIAENSILEFRELALVDGGRMTHLALTQGTGSFYANLASNDSFVVSTPHLSAQLQRNARVRLDVNEGGTVVGVMKGDVEVAALGNTYRVSKNRELEFRAGDEQIILAKLPEMDAWDRWVADREDALVSARNRSLHYADTGGYNYGFSDLSTYGSWYNVAGYGWGWQPYGIGVGWLPYSNGYWYYLSGIGYSWCSYEPWGWTPYHFGSWILAPGRGWVWIPGYFNHWHPARVYYVWNNGHVGWGPRGPHDRPGQTPTNLPHGTVTTGGGAIGPGGRGGRVTREDLGGPGTGLRFGYNQPEGFGGAVRSAGLAPRFPRDGGREGLRGDAASASGEGTANGAAAPRYSGSMPTVRSVPPEQRADAPRGGRHPRGEAPAGIVYDPNSGRYINGAPASSRPSMDNSASPAPQPAAGYSGTRDTGERNVPGGKPGQPVAPGIDRRNGDDVPTPRGSQPASAGQPSAGYSGRRDDGNDRGAKPGRPVAPGIDRRNGDDQPRPGGRNDVRVDSPRNDAGYSGRSSQPAPQPRTDSPRPYTPPPPQQPRMDSPRPMSPPPPPPPRVESPRPQPAPAQQPRPSNNGNKPGNSFMSRPSSGGSSSGGSHGGWGSRPSGNSSRPSSGRPH